MKFCDSDCCPQPPRIEVSYVPREELEDPFFYARWENDMLVPDEHRYMDDVYDLV